MKISIPIRRTLMLSGLGLALSGAMAAHAEDAPVDGTQQVKTAAAENFEVELPFRELQPWVHSEGADNIRLTKLQPQPAPLQTETVTAPTASSPAASQALSARLFGTGQDSSLLADSRKRRARKPGTNVVLGDESKGLATSDVGNLLFKSNKGVGIGSQRRTPIITDTRVRGKSLGRLIASGSYWVPARDDLDTILSKIDSRIVEDVIVVKGPYAVNYGPGFSFVDFQLKESPRYNNGPETHGSTSLEYQTQGDSWYGRQVIEGGDDDWGFRIGYGHRTAVDYSTGDGTQIPSGYNSRNFDVALGYDPTENSHVEFSYLRQDQTDVEFPGAFFNLDMLITDGFEVRYVLENQDSFDRFEFETWWNQTRFQGQGRDGSPILQALGIVEDKTDGHMYSTGYSSSLSWGQDDEVQLKAGTDLRYVRQELTERVDLDFPPFFSFTNIYAGVPESNSSNPGLFMELSSPTDDCFRIQTGARVDFYSASINEVPTGDLVSVPQVPITSLDQLGVIHGTDHFDRDLDPMWAAFLTAEYDVDDNIMLNAGAGHSQRPPTLTEFFATNGPFLSVLQSGLTAVNGNPGRLVAPRMWQIDVGLTADYENVRGGVSGFHSWIDNYITMEHIGTAGLPFPGDQQRSYRFINTPRATLAGAEIFGEADLTNCVTGFATMSYVEGRDKTRNAGGRNVFNDVTGNIDYDPSLTRGVSGGGSREPLPNISPLETRVGLRLHNPNAEWWVVEMSARIVDNQDRIATSLVETESPGFTTFNVRSVVQATEQFSMIVGVENLTDKYYREHLDLRGVPGLGGSGGVFQPGRNWYFGGELTY